MTKPHEPGCPVRGKDGLCPESECQNLNDDEQHHGDFEFSSCPGFLDAEPLPGCERRKGQRRIDTNWIESEGEIWLCDSYGDWAIVSDSERRSGNDRRKGA